MTIEAIIEESDENSFLIKTTTAAEKTVKNLGRSKTQKIGRREIFEHETKTPGSTRRQVPKDKKQNTFRSKTLRLNNDEGMDKKEREEKVRQQHIAEVRRRELERLAKQRRANLIANENLKLNREQLCNNVSQILIGHIIEAERLLPEATEGAKLFHEYNFTRHQWHIHSANGYPSTMPLFYFVFERVEYEMQECSW
jgi:hypothetical protein